MSLAVGEILSTILGGGVTGLIGTAFSSWMNFKQQKMNNEHEIAKIKANSEAMKLEAEANIKIAETKTAGEIQVAEMKAFEKSMEEGGKDMVKEGYIDKLLTSKWLAPLGAFLVLLMGFVDALRNFIRPGVTLYMLGATTWLAYLSYSAIDKALSNAQLASIFEMLVQSIIYTTVSCVSWWFGDRQLYKMISKKRRYDN
jgi:hypothetical protein